MFDLPETTSGPTALAVLLLLLGLLGLMALLLLSRRGTPLAQERFWNAPLHRIFIGWTLLWFTGAIALLTLPAPETGPIGRSSGIRVVGAAAPAAGRSQPAENGTLQAEINPEALLVSQGCGGCHLLEGVSGMTGRVGPPLDGIGERAAARVLEPAYTGEAADAAAYLRESIVAPNLYLVPDYPPVMPEGLDRSLSNEEFDALVTYLLDPNR